MCENADASVNDLFQNFFSGKRLEPSKILEILSYAEVETWDYYCEINTTDTWGGENTFIYGLECYELRDSLGRSIWIGVLLDKEGQIVTTTLHGSFSELFSHHNRYGFVVLTMTSSDDLRCMPQSMYVS